MHWALLLKLLHRIRRPVARCGTTINEAAFKANADWLAAHLKPFGWQYVVIDEEWYGTDPVQGNSQDLHYTMDRFGRYTPALNRFPSAAGEAGFTSLADYVHRLGLKFGIHILRSIPRQAVEENLPIADRPTMQPKPQAQPTPASGTTTTMASTPASPRGKPTTIRWPDSTPTGRGFLHFDRHD